MGCLILLFVLTLASQSFAQSPVSYHITFENAAHHEAEITVVFSELSTDPLEVRMSRTSPGRYALHEFAKNVYNVRATDGQGRSVVIERANPHQWNVAGHNGTVRLTYTVFGDRADGTYLAIDRTHAHMNTPATFMWARGLEDRPIEVTLAIPDPAWNVATQLEETSGKTDTYTAPNLAYFIDSPIEVSAFDVREWTVTSMDRTATIRLAIHHDGSAAETDAYAKMVQAVVLEQGAIFGKLPDYDYGVYTFIADYLPHVNGDGMEHRNSTILSSTGSLRRNPIGLLGTVSHEFFHCWNVERIRPATLEPFDLEHANMSSELWFAEGFTSYYDDLTMKRAGILSIDRYAAGLGRNLHGVINAPGRRSAGPADMSKNATFVDAGVSIDRRNFQNTHLSYYSYGAAIGLGLDLTLRTRFPNLTLDDFMRAVWVKHGEKEIPYVNEDLQTVLGEVTGDVGFAREFFANHIFGNEVVDYKSLLARAGLLFRKAYPDSTWMGQPGIVYSDTSAVLRGPTRMGSPLYRAGLDRGDVIHSIAGRMITSDAGMVKLLADYQSGETVSIEYTSRGIRTSGDLTFQEHPQIEVIPFENVGQVVTPAIRDFRQHWLSSKLAQPQPALQRYCHTCKRTFPFELEFCSYDGETLNIIPPQD